MLEDDPRCLPPAWRRFLGLRRLLRRAVCGGALHLSSRIAELLRPVPPLRLHTMRAAPAGSSSRHLVFLPGIGDLMEDYERYGFLVAAREHGVAADMTLVDAHYGFYANRSILERLQDDVIRPVRQRGCADIVLIGISLGGLGALLYAARHPHEIARVVVLAPYLGAPHLIDEIRTAGGLPAWSPTSWCPPGEQHPEVRALWRWVQGWSRGAERRPAIVLGYGEQDRFALGHRLLATALPAPHVLTIPGGHDWATWRGLWERLLTRRLLES